MIKSILTWNNISKYSANSLILNSERIPISEQWFNEQLIHMCDHLKIDIFNEIGIQIPRKMIINKINTLNSNFSFDYCETCEKLGMINLEKIPNEYNYRNIGGKIIQKLKYENNKIIIDTSIPLFDLENKDKIIIIPKVDKRFLLSLFQKQTKKHTKKQTTKQLTFLSLLEQITQKNRKDLSLKHMSKAKKNWEKWGKLDHYQKSSSLDCIFMMISVSNLEIFFKNIMIVNDEQQFYRSLSLTIEPGILKKKIESFLDEIINYKNQIIQGEIINVLHFRDRIRGLFGKIKLLNKPYYNTINYNPIFFIKDIFKLFDKSYTGYTRLNRYYIEKNDELNYSGTDGKKYKNPIIDNPLYQIYDEKLSDIIIFSIDNSLLKYLQTRNTHVNYDEYVENNRLEEIKYCDKCNEFYERTLIRKHEKSWHKNNQVEIQELLNVQIDFLNVDWILSEGWNTKKIGESNVFFKKDEEDNLATYLTENDILKMDDPPARKYERIVENLIIFNAELIIIDFNRNLGRKNLNTLAWESDYYEELAIMPNETIIDINNNVYNLEIIVTNRNNLCMLFLKSEDTWLCYNSHYNVENSSDYISEIGNYEKLIEYKDKFIMKYGILYIYKSLS